MKKLLLAALLTACGQAPDNGGQNSATPAVKAAYEATQKRLMGGTPEGWVISLSGETETAQGDSLLFTGIGMGVTDCLRGLKLENALVEMSAKLSGGAWRHPTIPDDVSDDGALGFYYGIVKRAKRCGLSPDMQEAFKAHITFVANHKGRLNPHSSVTLAAPLEVVLKAASHVTGLGDGPTRDEVDGLGVTMATWAEAVRAKNAACYRVHLGLLALQTLEAAGYHSPIGRNAFCAATKTLDLPTTNYYCGRDGLDSFLADFRYDVYEYRHQRCPAWESADGDGLWRPAIDHLIGLVDMYGLGAAQ